MKRASARKTTKPAPRSASFSTTRMMTVSGGLVVLGTAKKAVRTRVVLVEQPSLMAAGTAETVRKIVSKPVTDEQHKRAAALAKKAQAAQMSTATAKFRKAAVA